MKNVTSIQFFIRKSPVHVLMSTSSNVLQDYVAASCCCFHCSGVSVFCVSAWIDFISSSSALFTILTVKTKRQCHCVMLPTKQADTIISFSDAHVAVVIWHFIQGVAEKNTVTRHRVWARRNLVQIVMKRNLNLFGHLCRMRGDQLVKVMIFRGRMVNW